MNRRVAAVLGLTVVALIAATVWVPVKTWSRGYREYPEEEIEIEGEGVLPSVASRTVFSLGPWSAYPGWRPELYRGRYCWLWDRTKQTVGTNHCLIYPTYDEDSGRYIIVSCLDNLGKGGAAGGIQCLNLMLGLPETAGLDGLALYP